MGPQWKMKDVDKPNGPCPGFPTDTVPTEWVTDALLGHAVCCPVECCQRWARRWRIQNGWMSHDDEGDPFPRGDPGE